MKKAIILLSSYNGEQYITEQIESLLNQSYKNTKIIIRDDGSQDKTREILMRYKKKYPEKIDLFLEKNIGVVKSFFRLISIADKDADYYCLCDQDDYWFPQKIERAIHELEKGLENHKDRIGLYFSNLTLTDDTLEILGQKINRKVIISLEKSIFQSELYGCTCLFTKEYLEILKKGISIIDSRKIILHDHFIYIVGNIFAKIIYDPNSLIFYRQHLFNVSGAHLNTKEKIKKIWRKYGVNSSKISEQLEEIQRVYSESISIENDKVFSEILELKKNFLKRFIFLIFRYPYTNNSIKGRILFSLIVLCNRF